MFSHNFILTAFALVFVGQVAAVPMPMPMLHALQHREAAPLDTIPAYVKRANVNTVPAEQPSMSLTGTIIPYTGNQGKPTKRDTNTVPEEVPTKSPNGVITQYVRRANVNTVPAEQPSMSLTGTIIPYSGNQGKPTKRD
ncbi:hypothetical protein EW026_g931, partial [Hermanssonia centrifuga]